MACGSGANATRKLLRKATKLMRERAVCCHCCGAVGDMAQLRSAASTGAHARQRGWGEGGAASREEGERESRGLSAHALR